MLPDENPVFEENRLRARACAPGLKAKRRLLWGLFAVALLGGLCDGIQRIRAEDTVANRGTGLPFTVYDEKGDANNHYVPSGWLGNTSAVRMDEACLNHPHGGKTCLRFEYSGAGDWAGIAWQDPANDWGDRPGGWSLTGFSNLVFWARGEKGGEVVTFKFGILGADKQYPDSAGDELDDVKLGTVWQRYSFNLAGKDLSRIKTGFAWTAVGQGRPVVFYLDDIRFE